MGLSAIEDRLARLETLLLQQQAAAAEVPR
jgi:hypothetical protein